MKKLSALLIIPISFISISCSSVDLGPHQCYPQKVMGARAYVTGRIISAKGSPFVNYDLKAIMDLRDSVFNGYEYEATIFIAKTDSNGYFSGVVYSEINNDDGLQSGAILGKVPFKYISYYDHKWKYEIAYAEFEYDTIKPYVRTCGPSMYVDTAAIKTFLHTDIGTVTVK